MLSTFRKFKEIDKLLEMLSLRKAGYTFEYLSDIYQCDRSSLRYQCRKYQIFPLKTKYIKNSDEVFDPKRIVHSIIIQIKPVPKPETKWVEIDGERINVGRSYSDYLIPHI